MYLYIYVDREYNIKNDCRIESIKSFYSFLDAVKNLEYYNTSGSYPKNDTYFHILKNLPAVRKIYFQYILIKIESDKEHKIMQKQKQMRSTSKFISQKKKRKNKGIDLLTNSHLLIG